MVPFGSLESFPSLSLDHRSEQRLVVDFQPGVSIAELHRGTRGAAG